MGGEQVVQTNKMTRKTCNYSAEYLWYSPTLLAKSTEGISGQDKQADVLGGPPIRLRRRGHSANKTFPLLHQQSKQAPLFSFPST